jgi:rhodanese-related sulfurtransferase
MSVFDPSQVPEVGVVDAHGADGHTVLLDVREADEWAAGHAPGAVWIPLGQLERARTEVPFNRRIACVCRSGNRSARAAEALISWGFDAVNVAGGMKAWAAAGLPVVRDDDAPGAVV